MPVDTKPPVTFVLPSWRTSLLPVGDVEPEYRLTNMLPVPIAGIFVNLPRTKLYR